MASYRVLIVDDHPDTAEVLSVLFHMLGHETRSALRGRDALQLAREIDPDLILLDIGLPDITGYEVVRALRSDSRRPDRYIAAVTGHCRPADVSRAVLAGFDDHITKPIDIEKIRLILRSADSHYAPPAPTA
jgi:CheY-like chemotaxis protein